MGLSEAVCNGMLDDYFDVTTTYAALTDSNGTEPSGGGYARVTVATSDWAAASGREKANTNTITFPAPTGDWGTMAKGKVFDAASGGNEIGSGDLTEPIEVVAGGTTPEFTAGNFVIKFTSF